MEGISSEVVAEYLDRSNLLHGLTQEERVKLAEQVRVSRHEGGEIVMRQGDPGDRMMIVAEGRLKVSTISPRGSEFLIALHEAGDVVGELALMDGRKRSADVTTLMPCVLLSLNAGVFREFVVGNPAAAMRMMCTMAERLRKTTTLVEETLFLDLPARLARRIHALADEFGEPCPEGIRVNHGLTQQEFADSLGVARETVSKQLAVWRDEGLLDVGRRYLIVTGMEGLADAGAGVEI